MNGQVNVLAKAFEPLELIIDQGLERPNIDRPDRRWTCFVEFRKDWKKSRLCFA